MKRLFNVTMEATVLIVAENEAEAEEIAHTYELREGFRETAGYEVSAMTYIPLDWHDDDAIPFGYRDPDDPDRTVRQWIALGAAPDMPVPEEAR